MNLDAPLFSLCGLKRRGVCVGVYDGDTVKCIFPFGGKEYKWNCRLEGIDTPEIRSKDPTEKVIALEARDFLREQILGKEVKIVCGDFDKYGRLLTTIKLGWTNINELMLNEGHAQLYDGGTKNDW